MFSRQDTERHLKKNCPIYSLVGPSEIGEKERRRTAFVGRAASPEDQSLRRRDGRGGEASDLVAVSSVV